MAPRSRNHRPLHLAPAHSRVPTGDALPAVSSTDLIGAESHPGPSTPEPRESHVLTDERAAACSDSGLIAAIRECEAMRHRFLHDQLVLLTEARRRGLRPSGGPTRMPHGSAAAEGAPT